MNIIRVIELRGRRWDEQVTNMWKKAVRKKFSPKSCPKRNLRIYGRKILP
jgi:hypothetical protein